MPRISDIQRVGPTILTRKIQAAGGSTLETMRAEAEASYQRREAAAQDWADQSTERGRVEKSLRDEFIVWFETFYKRE